MTFDIILSKYEYGVHSFGCCYMTVSSKKKAIEIAEKSNKELKHKDWKYIVMPKRGNYKSCIIKS